MAIHNKDSLYTLTYVYIHFLFVEMHIPDVSLCNYFGIKINVLFFFLFLFLSFLFRRMLLDTSEGGTAQVNMLVLSVTMYYSVVHVDVI